LCIEYISNNLQLTIKQLTKAKAVFEVIPLPTDAIYSEEAVKVSAAAFTGITIMINETEKRLGPGIYCSLIIGIAIVIILPFVGKVSKPLRAVPQGFSLVLTTPYIFKGLGEDEGGIGADLTLDDLDSTTHIYLIFYFI
jgi:hypothetical protein